MRLTIFPFPHYSLTHLRQRDDDIGVSFRSVNRLLYLESSHGKTHLGYGRRFVPRISGGSGHRFHEGRDRSRTISSIVSHRFIAEPVKYTKKKTLRERIDEKVRTVYMTSIGKFGEFFLSRRHVSPISKCIVKLLSRMSDYYR